MTLLAIDQGTYVEVQPAIYLRVEDTDGWVHLREHYQRETLCGLKNSTLIARGGKETSDPADCPACEGDLLRRFMKVRDRLFGHGD